MARRQRLFERREQLGKTQAEVAREAGCNEGTYRNYESGRSTPRPGDRPALAEALEWTTLQLSVVLSDDPQPVNGHAVPGWLGHLASLEQGSGRLCAYEATTAHGLLQTADYATAVESIGPEPASDSEIARRVGARLARQAVLTRSPDPLALTVVLDESVLHRMAGGPEVMAAQLEHLADVADWPNVDLHVLPLGAGMFAFGSLTLLTQPGAAESWVAITEDLSGPHFTDRDLNPAGHARHVRLFDYLTGLALDPAASVDLLIATAKEYRQ
jgi:transcriptional regulator with XRE-family HTH domain